MSGYVASARIPRVSPRLARGERFESAADPSTRPVAIAILEIEAVPRAAPRAGRIAERWRAARERWSQLTFYVSDANSWR